MHTLLQWCEYRGSILVSLAGLAAHRPPTFAAAAADAHLTARVTCRRAAADTGVLTPRELDLQQQRRCVLAAAGGNPPGGYLAICLAIRNQHADLPEWLDYHRRLGVSHVYAMDDGSTPPLDDVLTPYVEVRGIEGCCSRHARRQAC